MNVVLRDGTIVEHDDAGASSPAGDRAVADLLRFPAVSSEPQSAEEALPPRLVQLFLGLMRDQQIDVNSLLGHPGIRYKFIQDVLRDPSMTEADVLRGGQLFGIDFTRTRAVILVDARDYLIGDDPAGAGPTPELVQRRAQKIINSVVSFFALPSDTICAYIGEGEIAILKASTTQDLAGWVEGRGETRDGGGSWANLSALKRAAEDLLRSIQRDTSAEITIGIGRYHPGVRGLAHSYQDARTALSLGRQSQGGNQVYCLDQLGIASFVGLNDERTKFGLAAHLLSPLDHAPELLETLDAFFRENCCPSTTAYRLEIHRNTLRYRLDKIASLTGLDPRAFDDAVQIRLALFLRQLNRNAA
ncbi:MAG TPA: helix-turn-helix domain-containing protein [Thermomicrobiaceae bacterium]|nr:helix-turn-helix domain-containing protein [Thermomicrobiaceae bacterium]